MSHARTILVVDDIPLMRTMLSKYLKKLGFKILREQANETAQLEVVEAANGNEALALLEKEPAADIIFLDLMMPEMDGLTFLSERAKSETLRSIPVIVCSAVGDRDVIRRASDLGAASYLLKPFSLKAVEQKFREALAELQAREVVKQ